MASPRCDTKEVYGEARASEKRFDGANAVHFVSATRTIFHTRRGEKPSSWVSGRFTMHELSIANRIVELVAEHVREAGAARATAVTVRIGGLSCVHEDALRFSFDLVREGTPASAAELRIVTVPVAIWCAACGREVALPGIQKFACPECGTPGGDIRAGLELDLESIELVDASASGENPP